MTFLVWIRAFPPQGRVKMGVYRAGALPYLLPCGLIISSGPLTWRPQQITLLLQTQVSNLKITIPGKPNLCSLGKKIHTHILTTHCTVGTWLLTSLYIFITSLILHVRTLGLRKFAQGHIELVSPWARISIRSARLRDLCFCSISHKPEHTLPFLTCSRLARKKLSSILYGSTEDKQPRGGSAWASLARAQSGKRVLWTGGLKGPSSS